MKTITKEETVDVLESSLPTQINTCSKSGCGKPAHCNRHGCWRQRTSEINIDCKNCEERLCNYHWRKLVETV